MTGWKSIYVNPVFTRKIINIPKAESDWVLRMLFDRMAGNSDIQVRFKWEVNSVAIWVNKVNFAILVPRARSSDTIVVAA